VIPTYLILLKFDLTDNLLGLVALSCSTLLHLSAAPVCAASPTNCWTPPALMALRRQTFLRIVIPQTIPALATFGTLVLHTVGTLISGR
jgi:ABC-type glycerol-3-phosphate transport system permease component